MAAANAMGDKLPMFVIGKAKNPSCRYRNQRKSLMGRKLFEKWLRELDRKFTEEMLLLWQPIAPAHPHIDNLKTSKL